MKKKSSELTKYLKEIRERMATKDDLAKVVTLEEFDLFRKGRY